MYVTPLHADEDTQILSDPYLERLQICTEHPSMFAQMWQAVQFPPEEEALKAEFEEYGPLLNIHRPKSAKVDVTLHSLAAVAFGFWGLLFCWVLVVTHELMQCIALLAAAFAGNSCHMKTLGVVCVLIALH